MKQNILNNSILTDSFGRRHEYLRISVTERCNLRCKYCMPAEGIKIKPKDELLTFDEIEKISKIFVSLGVKKIRITGGEPLVRKDLPNLLKNISQFNGLESLALSTNGLLLGNYIHDLKNSGVTKINVSLDSLKADKFNYITRSNNLENILEGIDKSIEAGFKNLKINVVVMRGFNDDEILDFINFGIEKKLNIRFIEYMPFNGNGWNEFKMIPYWEIKNIIEEKYQLKNIITNEVVPGPAKEFKIVGTEATVGFISTMSEHFCSSCNRLRLTSDGKLRNCLFAKDGVDLKKMIRENSSDAEIFSSIKNELNLKWEEHPDAKTLTELNDRSMVAIGG